MTKENKIIKRKNKKIIVIANSSKYIFHYRFLLLNKLKKYYNNVFVIAPHDKYSESLKQIVKFKKWKVCSENDFDQVNLIKSFYKIFKEIRSIKPDLVHSHTLKPNLIISIINFIFGINTIISFAGLGRLSNSKGINLIILKLILSTIYFSSFFKIENFIFIRKNYDRVKLIFQNPIDLNFFLNSLNIPNEKKIFYLIPGSGVPNKYFHSIKKYSNIRTNNFDFIYCARLEKSKGIKLFINLSFYYPNSKFFIYGDINGISNDYLSKDEIKHFQTKNKNLLFMGYKNDPLLNHHNDNTIFVIPSNYGEGLPRGILEALSLEIPIIANEKSCVGLFDEKYLFCVNNNNINSYIQAIDLIYKKKLNGLLNNFLSCGKVHVEENYKESIIVEKTIKLYQNFLNY